MEKKMEATLVYRGFRFGIRVQGLPIAYVESGEGGNLGGLGLDYMGVIQGYG